MNRKVLLFALAIMALAAFSAFADDYDPRGAILPGGATDPGTYQLDGENWVPTTFAMTFNSGPVMEGMSNKELHEIEIINHVSVAQWIEYSISGTRKDWRILQPGTYASDSVTATLKSNNDVVIEFYAEDPTYLGEGGVTTTIPKWFGISEGSANGPDDVIAWIRVNEYDEENPFIYTVPDSAGLHAGYSFKVWERIVVVPSNSSSDYQGRGKLTLRLTNMKHWVDPETGGFYDGGLSPSDLAGEYVD